MPLPSPVPPRIRFFSCTVGLGVLLSTGPALAQAQSFSDVLPGGELYEAVEHLKQKGVITGYSDGTFQPNRGVNRAEAVKLIVAPLVSAENLKTMQKTVFSDIPASAWYLSYVEWAYQKLQIVQGPPKTTTFNPEKPVTKAEFIKMLLLAHKIDPKAFDDIKIPLSSDLKNPDEWYYPYLRYAISSSMTTVSKSGLFSPGRDLTRTDVALLIYRLSLYREGKRTQVLLTEVENEVKLLLDALEKNDVTRAEFASARAILAARGAHAKSGAEPIVNGVVKLAEGYRALVRAYRAGINGNFDAVIKLCGDAWFLGDQGKQVYSAMYVNFELLQTNAKTLADSARALKKK